MMTEAYTSIRNTMPYYGGVENGKIVRYGAQIPFNFQLITNTNASSKASDYKRTIESWLNAMPKGDKIHANWVVSFEINFKSVKDSRKIFILQLQIGNHDRNRIASRCGPARTDLFNILLKTVPGIAVTYYASIRMIILNYYPCKELRITEKL